MPPDAGTLSAVNDYLRSWLGVDPDSDEESLCALATTGYVVSCWRNTILEDIHSGGFAPRARASSYARDGIPDADMARLNVATWRQVRPFVTGTHIDVMGVRALLRDKARPLVLGIRRATAGELFAGAWTKLRWHLNEGAWLPLAVAEILGGEAAAVRYYAACGGSYAPDWFGNPWWATAVRAWSTHTPPVRSKDLELALEAPNLLDERGIEWLMEAHFSDTFRSAIRAWQTEHGADHTHASQLPLIPPGVPDFPPSMQ